ncbi:MAG: zf-TFIIB domain-containing protein [Gemmatimonadaceae bacterium]
MPIEEKPSRNEDEYFVRRDAELMSERRARLDEERARLDEERTKQERSAHHNKCPRCGCELEEREHHGVKIDECVECGGMWLDKGELEIIEEIDAKSSGFMKSLFRRGR